MDSITWLSIGLTLLLITVGVLMGYFVYLLRSLESRLDRLTRGRDGANLEEVIAHLQGDVRIMDEEIQELFEISNQIHKLANQGLHHVALSRYNPFAESGGNQSFSLALLNSRNDGFVVTGLHARESCRVYAKPVTGGLETVHPFTEEEKAIVQEAATGKPPKKKATKKS